MPKLSEADRPPSVHNKVAGNRDHNCLQHQYLKNHVHMRSLYSFGHISNYITLIRHRLLVLCPLDISRSIPTLRFSVHRIGHFIMVEDQLAFLIYTKCIWYWVNLGSTSVLSRMISTQFRGMSLRFRFYLGAVSHYFGAISHYFALITNITQNKAK